MMHQVLRPVTNTIAVTTSVGFSDDAVARVPRPVGARVREGSIKGRKILLLIRSMV